MFDFLQLCGYSIGCWLFVALCTKLHCTTCNCDHSELSATLNLAILSSAKEGLFSPPGVRLFVVNRIKSKPSSNVYETFYDYILLVWERTLLVSGWIPLKMADWQPCWIYVNCRWHQNHLRFYRKDQLVMLHTPAHEWGISWLIAILLCLTPLECYFEAFLGSSCLHQLALVHVYVPKLGSTISFKQLQGVPPNS